MVFNALPAPCDLRFYPIDPARAAQESGLPVAYIQQPPAPWSRQVSVSLSPYTGPWIPHQISFAWRSAVRYTGGGHTVVVVLGEPSPAAIKRYAFLLGEHT